MFTLYSKGPYFTKAPKVFFDEFVGEPIFFSKQNLYFDDKFSVVERKSQQRPINANHTHLKFKFKEFSYEFVRATWLGSVQGHSISYGFYCGQFFEMDDRKL